MGAFDLDAMELILGRHGLTGRVAAVLGRRELTELGSYGAVVDRNDLAAGQAVIVSDQVAALWRARDSGLMPIGLATKRGRRKHLAAWGGDEFAAVVSKMRSLAAAIRACPLVAKEEQ